MPGDLKTRLCLCSMRRDLEQGSERRMEPQNCLVSVKSNMAEKESFKIRKRQFLTSYFDLGPTEELINYPVN